jgi:hypothetical protein
MDEGVTITTARGAGQKDATNCLKRGAGCVGRLVCDSAWACRRTNNRATTRCPPYYPVNVGHAVHRPPRQCWVGPDHPVTVGWAAPAHAARASKYRDFTPRNAANRPDPAHESRHNRAAAAPRVPTAATPGWPAGAKRPTDSQSPPAKSAPAPQSPDTNAN